MYISCISGNRISPAAANNIKIQRHKKARISYLERGITNEQKQLRYYFSLFNSSVDLNNRYNYNPIGVSNIISNHGLRSHPKKGQ